MINFKCFNVKPKYLYFLAMSFFFFAKFAYRLKGLIAKYEIKHKNGNPEIY